MTFFIYSLSLMFIISVEQFLALFRHRLCCFAVHVPLDKLGLTFKAISMSDVASCGFVLYKLELLLLLLLLLNYGSLAIVTDRVA